MPSRAPNSTISPCAPHVLARCGCAVSIANRGSRVKNSEVPAPSSVQLRPTRLTVRPILAQIDPMTGDQIPSLIMQIIDELRARGVLITNRGGDWCVNLQGGTQATEYLTDDLQDAFEHGRAMAASQTGAPAPEKPPEIRRKWRRPMSAKAQRRRMIKAHNYRLRARGDQKAARRRPRVISEIDIWRAAVLMMKRFGDGAPIESGKRADELANAGDDAGAAIWRRIEDAVEKLASYVLPAGRSTEICVFRQSGAPRGT